MADQRPRTGQQPLALEERPRPVRIGGDVRRGGGLAPWSRDHLDRAAVLLHPRDGLVEGDDVGEPRPAAGVRVSDPGPRAREAHQEDRAHVALEVDGHVGRPRGQRPRLARERHQALRPFAAAPGPRRAPQDHLVHRRHARDFFAPSAHGQADAGRRERAPQVGEGGQRHQHVADAVEPQHQHVAHRRPVDGARRRATPQAARCVDRRGQQPLDRVLDPEGRSPNGRPAPPPRHSSPRMCAPPGPSSGGG